MKRFHFISPILLVSLLSVIGVNAYADDNASTSVTTTTAQTPEGNTVVKEVTKTVRISTPVPAPKEEIAAPQGYVTCFTVDEGWFNGTWVPSHKVCQYENSGEGVVWISGYWGCNKATNDGVCTNWEWKSGHWQKTLIVY